MAKHRGGEGGGRVAMPYGGPYSVALSAIYSCCYALPCHMGNPM